MATLTRALDELLPRYDVHEVHRRRYAATPAAVRAAIEGLRASELPLTRLLMGLRTLPARLFRRGARPAERPLVEQLAAGGFSRLADTPDEVVFGLVGRFWRPTGGRLPAVPDAAAFRAFAAPGYAKAVMSFELRQAGGGTELLTETRVLATSAGARRAFRAYWAVVGPGSALIRREMLAAWRAGSDA